MSDIAMKRQCIQLQTRQTVAKVYDYMKKDAQEIIDLVSDPKYCTDHDLIAKLRKHLNATQKRAASAVGISERTIQTILKEKTNSNFKSPYKNRKECHKKLDINNFYIEFVQSYIESYRSNNKRPPTFEDMMTVFREELYYDGSVTTLRNFLAKLGYKWQRIEKKYVIVK